MATECRKADSNCRGPVEMRTALLFGGPEVPYCDLHWQATVSRWVKDRAKAEDRLAPQKREENRT